MRAARIQRRGILKRPWRAAGQTLAWKASLEKCASTARMGTKRRLRPRFGRRPVRRTGKRKKLEEIRLKSQDAEGIKVKTTYPEDHAVLRVHKRSSYSVDYDISMPADSKLWVRSGFGNLEVRGVQGWADIENGHGQLVSRDSGSTKLVNSFGSVEAAGAIGNVWIVNNNGSVQVSTVKGALDVKDRFASITVSNVDGAVTISGGNGAVELSDAGSSTVSNSFGSVTAKNIHGSLTVTNNNGLIDVDTVQDLRRLRAVLGPSILRT